MQAFCLFFTLTSIFSYFFKIFVLFPSFSSLVALVGTALQLLDATALNTASYLLFLTYRALRGTGIDSKESIPPEWGSIPGLLKKFTNSGSGYECLISLRRRIGEPPNPFPNGWFVLLGMVALYTYNIHSDDLLKTRQMLVKNFLLLFGFYWRDSSVGAHY